MNKKSLLIETRKKNQQQPRRNKVECQSFFLSVCNLFEKEEEAEEKEHPYEKKSDRAQKTTKKKNKCSSDNVLVKT